MQKNGARGKTPGRWEELTISNDFMFCRVMSDADVCGEFIERLLGIKVARIEYVQPQKDVRITPDARGVRFDVAACSTAERAADTLEIVREHGRDLPGVIHCFSYSKEIACAYVKMGYYIGVGGVVTFKNGRRLKETVAEIPLTSIVLETDCPYLAPEPNRGKRNSSLNLPFVIRQIAEIKGIDPQEVEEITCRNAKEFFGIGTGA